MSLVAAALIVAGCGGGDDASTSSPTPTPTPTPAASGDSGLVSTGAGGVGGTGSSGGNGGDIASSTAKPGEPVTITELTPKRFARLHCKQAIVVVLYQPKSVLDAAMLREARIATRSVKRATIIPYTAADEKAYGDLPAKLGLLEAPGVAVVGRDGAIENFWSGMVDHELIARSVRNAAKRKACAKGTSGAANADATETVQPNPIADAASLAASGAAVAPAGAAPSGGANPAGTAATAAAAAAAPASSVPSSTGGDSSFGGTSTPTGGGGVDPVTGAPLGAGDPSGGSAATM